MVRWILFITTIILGAAAGLYVGWIIHPLKQVEPSPAALREDYKADYVLMVAEAYHYDGDLPLALQRLSLLNNAAPDVNITDAIAYATKSNPPYAETDLSLMRELSAAIQTYYTTSGSKSQ
jgi:uncharacterized SAM-binding protein YcdF (DUF218 family)